MRVMQVKPKQNLQYRAVSNIPNSNRKNTSTAAGFVDNRLESLSQNHLQEQIGSYVNANHPTRHLITGQNRPSIPINQHQGPHSSIQRSSVPERTVAQREEWSRGALDGKKTDVTWRTSKLGGDTVGMDMTANPLGPEHLQGSPPQSGVQKNLMGQLPTDPGLPAEEKFIRGHLLNDNLGGPGLDFNLYPITADANKQHHDRIEKPVKKWVNEDKQWVMYSVFAVQRTEPWYDSVFECEAQVLNPTTLKPDGPKITANIESTYKSKRGEYNEVTVEEGSLHPKGIEAENYIPLLSSAKSIFLGLNEDLQTSLIYCFSVDPKATIKHLSGIPKIGKKTIELLEIMAEEEDFSNPNEEQQRALKKIERSEIDVLAAVTAVAFEFEDKLD